MAAAVVLDDLFGGEEDGSDEDEAEGDAWVMGALRSAVDFSCPAPRWTASNPQLATAWRDRLGGILRWVEVVDEPVDVLICGTWADCSLVVPGGLAYLTAETTAKPGWVALGGGPGLMRRRRVSCDSGGERGAPTAAELDRADECTVNLPSGGADIVVRAAKVLRERGVVILPGLLNPQTADAVAKDALADFESCRLALLQKSVDILDPLGSDREPQSYRELAMREDFRCDIRGTPRLAGQRSAMGEHRVLVATARLASRSADSSTLASGNYGRWNFEDGGPGSPPLPLHIGALGAVISLPKAAEQALHADAPHLFEHVDNLPAHYINAFFGSTSAVEDDKAGHTAFVAGSHVLSNAAKLVREPGKSQRCAASLIRPRLGPGDVLLFDARILHFGLANRSSRRRPIIYCNYTEPWFVDPKNWNDQDPLLGDGDGDGTPAR